MYFVRYSKYITDSYTRFHHIDDDVYFLTVFNKFQNNSLNCNQFALLFLIINFTEFFILKTDVS